MRSLTTRGKGPRALVALTFLVGLTASTPIAASEGKPRAVKVTVLSTMLADRNGVGEWGFAALVEVDGYRLLFDTGAREETVLRNAAELKVDLTDVTDVVLSHNHGDHTGGLLTLRRELQSRNPLALSRGHVAPGIFLPRRSEGGGDAERNPMRAVRGKPALGICSAPTARASRPFIGCGRCWAWTVGRSSSERSAPAIRLPPAWILDGWRTE